MNTTQNPSYELTPSDKLFYKLMGFYPTKAGTAFELISTAVTMIMQTYKTAKHNLIIEGNSSASHQIDGIVDSVAIEAKDHSAGKKITKVSIGEVMKHEAAICDIKEVSSGMFFSSSGFSQPAKQYADGLCIDFFQKAIQLVHTRPATSDDEKGRIKCIDVQIHALFPEYKFQIILSEEVVNSMQEEYNNANYLPILCNALGTEVLSFEEAIDAQYDDKESNLFEQKVETKDMYIKTQAQQLIPIKGFVFNRNIHHETITFRITANGTPVLWVKSDSLEINKLFTDIELRNEINKLI